jgi:hypothetical protein
VTDSDGEFLVSMARGRTTTNHVGGDPRTIESYKHPTGFVYALSLKLDISLATRNVGQPIILRSRWNG